MRDKKTHSSRGDIYQLETDVMTLDVTKNIYDALKAGDSVLLNLSGKSRTLMGVATSTGEYFANA